MMRSLVVRRFLAATVIAATGLVSVAGEAFESVAAPRTHTMPGLSEPFSSMPFAPGITPPPDDASLDGVRYRYIVSNAYLGALGPNAATEDFQAYPGIYECPDDAFIPDGEKVRVDMNQCRLATAWHLEPFRMKSIRDAEIADGQDEGSYLPPGARLPLDADLPAYDAQPTWLPTHQAWNHWEPAEGKDFHAEHTEIAEVAAEAAGLLAQTTIFERFFLRYPTANRVVASAQKGGQGGSRYTIGQSFAPTGHVARTGGTFEAPSALATRGVSLLELVQLPDFSHSLMDWANGNEACPPSIGTAIGGMYRDQDPIHSCHEFSRVMGSMNASHFYPLAKSFYEHYHALAKARMGECPEAEPAAQIDEYFWPEDDILHSFGVDMGISPKHTPGHVCEREAMAYEMIAQHFLQDGWSTGHMWHRWGYPEIDKFNFALPGENPAHIPAATQRPRRAAVAMLTAMAAGQIHGARSVIDRQIRDYFDRETAERILATGLTDDPLSAPRLTDFQLTSWIPGASPETGVPAVFPGAGDLYWDPFVPTDPDDPDAEKLQVRWAPTYDRQRTQMIACAATSMLEVYKAGSQIHGELAEGPIFYNPLHGGDPVLLLGGGDEAVIDTLGDYCWGQLATNLSMEHATGVVSKLAVAKGTGFEASLLLTDAATAIVQAFGQNFSALVANVVVLDQEVKGALDFPTGPAPNEPFDDDVPCTALAPPADRICDRERFITGSTFGVPVGARVGLRLQQDSLNTMTQFFLNRIHTAHGSSSAVARKSARLLDGDGNSITMLGVPPSHEAMISEGGQKKDPIVPYVDRPVQSYDAFTPVQHMFWRGRIKEICEHTATNWSAVEQLQTACRVGSSNGGNVAACTSCVEIASLHAPLRGLTPEIHPAIDQTACSLVGTYALDYSEGLQRIVGAPAGIPSEWFDLEDGDAAPGEVTYAYDWTPGKVAFHWCTGVPNELLDEEAAVGSIIPAETDARVFEACPQVGPSTITYTPEGTYDLLRAWTEGGRSTNSLVAGLPTPGEHHISDLQQFLPEVVSIRERQTDTLTDCDTYSSHRSRTSSDFDARIQEVLRGLPYVDNAQYGTRVLQSSKTGLYAPVCGESMGYSAWTVSCDEVRWLFDAAGYFDSFVPEVTEAPPGESWNPSYAQFVSTSDGKCVVHEPARFRQCPQGSECGADGRCRLSTVTCNDLSCQKPEVRIIE